MLKISVILLLSRIVNTVHCKSLRVTLLGPITSIVKQKHNNNSGYLILVLDCHFI